MAYPRRLLAVPLLLTLTLAAGLGIGVAAQDGSPPSARCGTPAASPAASPIASPAGSPAASPVASPAAATCGTPAGAPGAALARVDLAAMALDSGDLPSGYERKFEGYVPGDQVAALVTNNAVSPAEIAATGLRWYYVSSYEPADGSSRISTYLEEYAQPAGAIAGFKLLEDEKRLNPTTPTRDLPGPGVGEQPSEITVASDTSGGTPLQFTEGTFRVGRLIGGVSVLKPGSAPDLAQIKDLSAKLERRMQDVLRGKAPAGVDLGLPATLLPIERTLMPVEEGYLSAQEAVLSSPTGATARAYRGGYERAVSAGTAAAPEPYVYVASLRFASADDALAALGQAATLDFPITGGGDRVQGLRIAGADAATAFKAAVGPSGNDDSFIVVFTVGDRLGAVAVIESPRAEAAALDLAAQQAACLSARGACSTVSIPASLTAPAAATPEATAAAQRAGGVAMKAGITDGMRIGRLGLRSGLR